MACIDSVFLLMEPEFFFFLHGIPIVSIAREINLHNRCACIFFLHQQQIMIFIIIVILLNIMIICVAFFIVGHSCERSHARVFVCFLFLICRNHTTKLILRLYCVNQSRRAGKIEMKKATTRQMSSKFVEFSNASNGFVSLIEIDCCSI